MVHGVRLCHATLRHVLSLAGCIIIIISTCSIEFNSNNRTNALNLTQYAAAFAGDDDDKSGCVPCHVGVDRDGPGMSRGGSSSGGDGSKRSPPLADRLHCQTNMPLHSSERRSQQNGDDSSTPITAAPPPQTEGIIPKSSLLPSSSSSLLLRWKYRYPIQLPREFVRDHSASIRNGTLFRCIPHVMLDTHRRQLGAFALHDAAAVVTVRPRQRRQQQRPNSRVMEYDSSLPSSSSSSPSPTSSSSLSSFSSSPSPTSSSLEVLERNSIDDDDDTFIKSWGTKRLLAIRVSSTWGEEPEESLASIEGAIFGTGANPDAIASQATVAAQYQAVSHGQLQFIPATTSTSNAITSGVMDVRVNLLFAGSDIGSLTDAIVLATQEALGDERPLVEVADTFLFCLPAGSSFEGNDDWTAFTHLLKPYSYYQRSRCTRLSVVMHEIGHSFGFQHSGTIDDLYGDKTDYMGFAANQMGTPRKGFNAHKHWISGWFESRALEVDPLTDGSVRTRVVDFVHPLNDTTLEERDIILVRIGRDLYLQYNRATGYNIDTAEPNTVTITEATAVNASSIRLAALAAGESYTYPNYNKLGYPLIIEVCSMDSTATTVDANSASIHFATVSIHWANGRNQSSCHRQSVRRRRLFHAGAFLAGVLSLACFVVFGARCTRRRIATTTTRTTDCNTSPKPVQEETSTSHTHHDDGDEEGIIAQVGMDSSV